MSGETVAAARALRKRMTAAETALWQVLRDRQLEGWKFRRQHPIGAFVLDFYCPLAKLAIELDGEIHSERAVSEADRARQEAIESLGVRFLRMPNGVVVNDAGSALREVLRALTSPSRSAEGEGLG